MSANNTVFFKTLIIVICAVYSVTASILLLRSFQKHNGSANFLWGCAPCRFCVIGWNFGHALGAPKIEARIVPLRAWTHVLPALDSCVEAHHFKVASTTTDMMEASRYRQGQDKQEQLKRRFAHGIGLFVITFLSCTSAIWLLPIHRVMANTLDYSLERPQVRAEKKSATKPANRATPTRNQAKPRIRSIRATAVDMQKSTTSQRNTQPTNEAPDESATSPSYLQRPGTPLKTMSLIESRIHSQRGARMSPLWQKKLTTTKKKRVASIPKDITAFLNDVAAPSSPIRIAHVTNFFPCETCPELFLPLDQSQNVTIASMQRAVQESKKAIPTVYAAVFEGDEFIVPDDFVTLSKRLERSTKTQYPELEPQRELPFLDDILSSLYDSDNTNEFDYVVYTNSDIALRHDFYDKVAAIVAMGHDAFAMNRLTIPKEIGGRQFTGNELDFLYTLSGEAHGGTDCFIFKKDYYRSKFTLGDVFLGYPPVGRTFSQILERSSQSWRKFRTFETMGTFHLGNDMSWTGTDVQQLRHQNNQNSRDLISTFQEGVMEK